MILLDTDHLTVLYFTENPRALLLKQRLAAAADPLIGTSVVCIEEQFRGWMAQIARHREVHKQITSYNRLVRFLSFLADWKVISLEQPAADRFADLRKQRIRIGTQDLKIAAIALANDALLLSANLRDFRAVPQLRVENWLE